MVHDMTTETSTPKKKGGRKPKSISTVKTDAPKKNYLNNADLLIEIEKSRQQGKMTEALGKMLMMLCERYAKHPRFANIYSYDEDMKAFALMTLTKVWRGFNPEKSKNPFAYFTQIITNAFFQYLNYESAERLVKDKIKIDNGHLPSFTYMDNYLDELHESRYSEDGMFEKDPTAASPVREIDYTSSESLHWGETEEDDADDINNEFED